MTQIEVRDGDVAEAKLLTQITWDAYKGGMTYAELAHAQTIAKLRVAREALDSIEVYGSDMMSGRVKPDPSTYQEWLISGVKEMRNRARQSLAQIKGQSDETA